VVAQNGIFVLVFVYFFVSIGLVVVVNATLTTLGKRNKAIVHWVRTRTNVIAGIILCLISLATLSCSETKPMYVSTWTPAKRRG